MTPASGTSSRSDDGIDSTAPAPTATSSRATSSGPTVTGTIPLGIDRRRCLPRGRRLVQLDRGQPERRRGRWRRRERDLRQLGTTRVQIYAGVNDNVVAGNKIGTDVTGTIACPTRWAGSIIDRAPDGNTIGGATAAAGNLITDNGGPGVGRSRRTTSRRQPDHRQSHLRQHGTGHRPRRRRGDRQRHLAAPGTRTTSRTSRSSSRPPTARSRAGWAAARPTRPSASISSPAPPTTRRVGRGRGLPGLAGGDDRRDRARSIFAVPFTAPAGLPIITATATDPQGNTSEVSALRRATLQAPPPSASRRAQPAAGLLATASGDGIAIQDPDAGPLDPVWNLTLSVSDGTLTLSSTAGLTGSGDGTGSLSYSGPLSAWTRRWTA